MTTDPSTPDLGKHRTGSAAGPTQGPGQDRSPDTTPDHDPHGSGDPAPRDVAHTRAASTYAFLVVGALVTVALLVFIVQNLSDSPPVNFFGLSYELPVGINMLIAALAGAIVTGLAGAIRITQLRRAYKKR